jgi:hypothetical protein
VLIKALVREYNVVHEVVARLEVTGFGTSQVTWLWQLPSAGTAAGPASCLHLAW